MFRPHFLSFQEGKPDGTQIKDNKCKHPVKQYLVASNTFCETGSQEMCYRRCCETMLCWDLIESRGSCPPSDKSPTRPFWQGANINSVPSGWASPWRRPPTDLSRSQRASPTPEVGALFFIYAPGCPLQKPCVRRVPQLQLKMHRQLFSLQLCQNGF